MLLPASFADALHQQQAGAHLLKRNGVQAVLRTIRDLLIHHISL